MRTSISILALVVASMSVVACSGVPGEEVGSGEAPVATLIPPPPPAPLPAFWFVNGYAGMPGQSGHNDGSSQTTFVAPQLITTTSTGATWVLDADTADASKSRLRIIFDTRGTVNPHVQTIYGPAPFTSPFDLNMIKGMTMDPVSLDLFVTGVFNGVYRFSMGGVVKPVATAGYFANPTGIVRDDQGRLYVANTGWGSGGGILVVDTAGNVTPMSLSGVSSAFAPTSLARDPRNGTLYTISQGALWAITSSGAVSLFAGLPTTSTLKGFRFRNPQGLAVDRSGNVYVADTGAHVIRKVRVDWGTTPLAIETVSNLQTGNDIFDNGGYGTSDTTILSPTGLAMWGDTMLFTDVDRHTVRRLF